MLARRIPKFLWKKYEKYLKLYPNTTMTITGGVLIGFGDICTQLLFEKESKYKSSRTLTMSCYGILQTKIEVMHWYNFLDKIVGAKKCLFRASLKSLIDTTFFAPVEIGMCLSWVAFFEGQEKSVFEKLKDEFGTIMITNYLVWLPSGFLLFYFIPVQYRALYSGLVGLGWDMYISFASHNSIRSSVSLV